MQSIANVAKTVRGEVACVAKEVMQGRGAINKLATGIEKAYKEMTRDFPKRK